LALAIQEIYSKKKGIETQRFFNEQRIKIFNAPRPYDQNVIDFINSLCPDALVYLSGFGKILKQPYLQI